MRSVCSFGSQDVQSEATLIGANPQPPHPISQNRANENFDQGFGVARLGAAIAEASSTGMMHAW
jgi:hypothetical protein